MQYAFRENSYQQSRLTKNLTFIKYLDIKMYSMNEDNCLLKNNCN